MANPESQHAAANAGPRAPSAGERWIMAARDDYKQNKQAMRARIAAAVRDGGGNVARIGALAALYDEHNGVARRARATVIERGRAALQQQQESQQ
ncbi:hypothetical protein [Diaphorobacter sp.]|nr:hypothetical protein [Diaphorobacter sp.]UOB04704.1 hypothetical protein MRB47_14930 [Diaphorobacter sp. LI3]